MIDWVVLLIPLAVLVIVALVPFVGCGELLTVSQPDPEPAPTTTPPAGPSPGGGTPPATPPPPPPPRTALELELASDINTIPAAPPNATKDKVESVLVTWTLSKANATAMDAVPQTIRITVVRNDQTRAFIDPALDFPVARFLTDDQVAHYDRVTCQCVVTMRPPGGGAAQVFPTPVTAPIAFTKGQLQIFRLLPDFSAAAVTVRPRRFSLDLPAPAAGPVIPGAPTRLQFNPQKDKMTDINEIKAGAPAFKVTEVKVTWTLSKTAGGPIPQPLEATLVRTVSSRAFLEPFGTPPDPSDMWDLTPAQLATYDTVTCRCEVTMRPTNVMDPDTDVFPPAGAPALVTSALAIKPMTNHVIVLLPDWSKVAAKPRRFTLQVQ